MDKMIAVSRQQVAKNAVKFKKMKLQSSEIKLVVGPNGQTIKKIIAEHDQPKIDIQEDGSVLIYHQSDKILNLIVDAITRLIKPVEVGETFYGTVDNIVEYGAFVKLEGRNLSGLIHVSNLSNRYVSKIESILKKGQRVKVQVIGFNKNKINLKLV